MIYFLRNTPRKIGIFTPVDIRFPNSIHPCQLVLSNRTIPTCSAEFRVIHMYINFIHHKSLKILAQCWNFQIDILSWIDNFKQIIKKAIEPFCLFHAFHLIHKIQSHRIQWVQDKFYSNHGWWGDSAKGLIWYQRKVMTQLIFGEIILPKEI